MQEIIHDIFTKQKDCLFFATSPGYDIASHNTFETTVQVNHLTHTCPCGQALPYELCCAIYLEGKDKPKVPEALMRSRYTAYSMGNTDYIKKTMRGKPLLGFNEIASANWAKSVQWLGLAVLKVYQEKEDVGFVEFVASYLENNMVKKIHELSEFHCVDGSWFYVDGELTKEPDLKISRNAPCPCSSQKKFKNCHAK